LTEALRSPYAQHGFLEKPHMTRRRLESLQLVHELPSESGRFRWFTTSC
jgi:hypothetical protein